MRDVALPVMGVVVLLLPLDIFSVAVLVFVWSIRTLVRVVLYITLSQAIAITSTSSRNY
jgi:hypothetical protein